MSDLFRADKLFDGLLMYRNPGKLSLSLGHDVIINIVFKLKTRFPFIFCFARQDVHFFYIIFQSVEKRKLNNLCYGYATFKYIVLGKLFDSDSKIMEIRLKRLNMYCRLT